MYTEQKNDIFTEITHNTIYQTNKKSQKLPLGTCLSAFSMIILGFLLLSLSIYFYYNNRNHGGFIPLLIVSLLILLPGIYGFYILYLIKNRCDGYVNTRFSNDYL